MLNMLERNRRIKPRPERFQEEARPLRFDVILTCEEKVYDLVLADFEAREEEGGSRTEQPVHVINVDIVSSFMPPPAVSLTPCSHEFSF